MRRAVLLPLLALAGACAPAAPAPAPVPATWAADEAAIAALLRGSSDAWNRADLRGHLGIYVDSVTFMTRDGPRPGIAPIEEAFSRTYWQGGRPLQELRFERVATRPLGEGAALQTGRFVLAGGGLPEQSGWFTLVWVRTPAGWRVVHDHSS
jgi:ketosteroid isomerase-like protein